MLCWPLYLAWVKVRLPDAVKWRHINPKSCDIVETQRPVI
jgi:hypothetical protein